MRDYICKSEVSKCIGVFKCSWAFESFCFIEIMVKNLHIRAFIRAKISRGLNKLRCKSRTMRSYGIIRHWIALCSLKFLGECRLHFCMFLLKCGHFFNFPILQLTIIKYQFQISLKESAWLYMLEILNCVIFVSFKPASVTSTWVKIASSHRLLWVQFLGGVLEILAV